MLLPVLAAACGRGREILGTTLDDGGAVPPATAPRFTTPALVTALSDPDAIDEDPTFTGDMLELYFMSTRAGTKDLWTSQRTGADQPWGTPSRVPELSSSNDEWCPAISLDGLRLWFASDRSTPGRAQLWQATRTARTATWGMPAPIAELGSPSADFAPALDATETLLAFSSNRGGDYDLYQSARSAAEAPWGAPQPIEGIASPSDEYDPFVALGGLILFFTSMRSGGGDIYWASRQSVAEPFGTPVTLVDVDSDAYDSDATLSQDLGYLMFSSARTGNGEIYEAHAMR